MEEGRAAVGPLGPLEHQLSSSRSVSLCHVGDGLVPCDLRSALELQMTCVDHLTPGLGSDSSTQWELSHPSLGDGVLPPDVRSLLGLGRKPGSAG